MKLLKTSRIIKNSLKSSISVVVPDDLVGMFPLRKPCHADNSPGWGASRITYLLYRNHTYVTDVVSPEQMRRCTYIQ